MEANLIALAKACPDAIISVKVSDLIEANEALVARAKERLEQIITDQSVETYPSREKVAELLDVDLSTLWRWAKRGLLVPIEIGGRRSAMKTGKAAVAALMQSKDTKELRLPQLKSMVLQMMKEGQRFTAKEINRIAGFNDARKFISDLRRHLSDYLVRDTRLNTGCKLYWLEPINTKPTLFSGQEAVSHE